MSKNTLVLLVQNRVSLGTFTLRFAGLLRRAGCSVARKQDVGLAEYFRSYKSVLWPSDRLAFVTQFETFP